MQISQLIGRYILLFISFCQPLLLFTIKQAFGNLGLLAGYDSNPVEQGLGHDRTNFHSLLSTLRVKVGDPWERFAIILSLIIFPSSSPNHLSPLSLGYCVSSCDR